MKCRKLTYFVCAHKRFCVQAPCLGGGSEQVVDTKQDAFNSWEWSF